MTNGVLPTVRKLLTGSPARKGSQKRELFLSIVPQILQWLDQGHTQVAILEHLATQGLPLSRSSFHRYLAAGNAGEAPAAVKPTNRTQSARQAKSRTTRVKPRPQAPSPPTESPQAPVPSAAPQPSATKKVTLDMLKAPDGSPRKLLSSFTPPPPIPLDEL